MTLAVLRRVTDVGIATTLALVIGADAAAQSSIRQAPLGDPTPAPYLSRITRAAPGHDSLRLYRPMTGFERSFIALWGTGTGALWAVLGGAAGGLAQFATCHRNHGESTLDALRSCHGERGVAIGGLVGVSYGVARGTTSAARRFGCPASSSSVRGYTGTLLGVAIGAAPAAIAAANGTHRDGAYVASAVGIPVLAITGGTVAAGGCRVRVRIIAG